MLTLVCFGCTNSKLDPGVGGDQSPGPQSTVDPPAGRFVSATPHENRESRNGLDALVARDANTAANRSYEPRPLIDTSDRRPPILSVELEDVTEYGVPIGLFSDKTLLMRRDGSIQFLTNSRIVRQRVLSDRFESMERNELAQQLYNEFGRRFAIKFEAPYLVVAHADNLQLWSQRFRGLFHSYKLYCKTHGIPLREIEFPLVAIVFGSQKDFQRYAIADGSTLPQNCVGYYSQKSNRIVLYESSQGIAQDTLETICHEATHQLAFNTGLHQRLAATPLWLAEGFATMFEAPKLSGLQSRDVGSMWPENRRYDWQRLSKNPDAFYRLIDSLVRNDSAFEKEPLNAYCGAWALTAYLSQRRPQQFNLYFSKVASLPPFENVEPSQRLAEFQSVFGKDTRLLAKSIQAFVDSID
jgi:hypothetical protein